MPKATTAVTVKPETILAVEALLSTYFDLKSQLDLLQAQADAEKAKIWELLKVEGVKKYTSADGTPVYEVNGTYQALDKEEFVTLGGDLKILEQATHAKPKKGYLQIGKDKSANS